MRSSEAELPMFFEPGHVGLGERCRMDFLEGDSPALHRAEEVIPYLGKAGYLHFLVPDEEKGRPVVSVRTLCLVREALAYRSPLADSIFAVQGLGSYPVVLSHGFAGRERFLEEIVAGTRVGAFALTEPEAGSDVASMRTTARQEGNGWRLDGEKVFISNAGIASHYIVFANADPAGSKKGISAFLVERGAEGLEVEPMPMSVDHPLGRLRLRGCRASALIGEVGAGMRLALGTLGVFRTSVGAAAVGMAARAFDETLEHVRTRKQFGQRLADFQLTQAALADMITELDAARLMVCRAAWIKDDEPTPRDHPAVAMAKMFATEAAQRIIDRAVQLHGGLGVVLGSEVERLYREIRALRIYEGTTEIQKLIIGSSLVKEAAR